MLCGRLEEEPWDDDASVDLDFSSQPAPRLVYCHASGAACCTRSALPGARLSDGEMLDELVGLEHRLSCSDHDVYCINVTQRMVTPCSGASIAATVAVGGCRRQIRRALAANFEDTEGGCFSWANCAGGNTGIKMDRPLVVCSSSASSPWQRAKRPTELALVPRYLRVASEVLPASTLQVREEGLRCKAVQLSLGNSPSPWQSSTAKLQHGRCVICCSAPCRCWQEANLRRQTFLECDNRLVSEDSYCSAGNAAGDDSSSTSSSICSSCAGSGQCRNHRLSPEERARRANEDGLGATHRATHRFVTRHDDEAELDIGDAVHVIEEGEDLWCKGVNLRTGECGIFPAVCLTDLKFYDIGISENIAGPQSPAIGHLRVKQPRAKAFRVRFLGSMEVKKHRGSEVISEAIQKVILARRLSEDSQTAPLCRLEVSEAGVKMIDLTHNKNLKKVLSDIKAQSISEKLHKLLAFHKESRAVSSHFFALKNISFCALHPSNDRYFAFITKHPTVLRFACHCFASLEGSTQDIAEAIGEAFSKFFQEYMAFSHRTEDIYLE